MTHSPEDELLRLLPHSYRREHIGQSKAISPAVCLSPLQPPHDHAAYSIWKSPSTMVHRYSLASFPKTCSCNPGVMVEDLSRLHLIYYIGNEQKWIKEVKLSLMDTKMVCCC